MAQNFIECDREQAFLMPPSLREWLPEDHLAWFVLEAVEEMDLCEFYADYRSDGHGRAAYEPSMMVALLLYAYATSQRSSRGIEIHCRHRVIAADRVPDHATIARFLARHEAALADLFGSVLRLCAKAGLVSTGVVAIDGTKLAANASREATSTTSGSRARSSPRRRRPTRPRTSASARRAAMSSLPSFGRARAAGPGLPRPSGRSMPSGRLIRRRPQLSSPMSLPRCRVAGRSTRAAATPASAWTSAVPARRARSRARAGRGLRSQSAGSRRSLWPSDGRMRPMRPIGRAGSAATGRFGGDQPSPYQIPETPAGKINTTDPDSRLLKAAGIGYVQGYNAQAAVNERQIVLAAEIAVDSPDFGQLEPMVDATASELERAGVTDAPQVVVADAGYWHHEQMDSLAAGGIQVLIPPDAGKRKTARPGWQGGRYEWMRRVLSTELGERLYRQRSQTVEPNFGHTKHNRGMSRFHRRGRSAARTEWRLITATHNFTKLHSHSLAAATP